MSFGQHIVASPDSGGPRGKLTAVKRALVTGGASGIGAACADVLEREGWQVIRADINATPGGASADDPAVRPLDVTDEDAWDRLMADIGPIDGLVTSAGIRTRSMIVDTTLDEWERHLRVNVTGTWLAIRAFLRAIPDHRPRSIVTIASVNATIAVPGQAHYVASKGAIASLSRAAALEGAPLGVRVNSIAPGPIRTPMASERLDDPEQVRWLTGRVPLGRVGEPSEIGEVAEFLLSDRASYISGEVVVRRRRMGSQCGLKRTSTTATHTPTQGDSIPMAYDVELDTDECVSAGKCVAAAPRFFVFDDDEIATIDQGGPRPADDALLRIARQCPSGAIKLFADGVEVEL